MPGGGGQSRFCRRKLCPEGFIFDEQTAQPPDLDGPSEAGYLCGLFVFGWTSLMSIETANGYVIDNVLNHIIDISGKSGE